MGNSNYIIASAGGYYADWVDTQMDHMICDRKD